METAIELLHEDDALIAVAKPSGLATITERDRTVPCLHKALQDTREERLWIVHRLDKDTSGVVVFARTAEAHRHLCGCFERREIQKSYTAVVCGAVERDSGTIDLPLRQFGSGRMGVDHDKGKSSSTTYRVDERLPGLSVLDVQPQTGRRHQIRVHLYALGYPIAGDPLYGDARVAARAPRLMLHARALSLPRDEGTLALEAPIPVVFRDFLGDARAVALDG